MIPSYLEDKDSQIPAIRLLQQIGYTYLPPKQIMELRDGLASKFILEDVLISQLKKINKIDYKGQKYPFATNVYQRACHDLQHFLDEGLVKTNENIYDLLTLGKSYEQVIEGDKKSFPFRFIDWKNPQNNDFKVTDEFEIKGRKNRRFIDIVLFVNGIPFVAIECKRRDKEHSLDEAISQHLRNQKPDDVPGFFHFTQMLIATNVNEFKYAVTGTTKPFWSIWREEEENEHTVRELISEPDTEPLWIERLQKHYEESPKTDLQERIPTLQDKNFYNLCRPQRLLELIKKFTVFDNNIRKIARYQQYFSVKHMLKRVHQKDKNGRRKGGVIWHTQGSGKSITMIFMSKNLALDEKISPHRMILVTDRTDLDEQLYKNFKSCGKEITKARTGKHLGKLIEDPGEQNISTLIHKFDAALNQYTFKNTSPDIFVLVDESHRSQYGMMHAKMRKALPNACYIGFTGTPLMKDEKNTARKFGGIIDSYTMDRAVKDEMVVPILYEGRATIIDTWKEKLDREFEEDMKGMVREQRAEYKARFSSLNEVLKSQKVIEEIGRNVIEHYNKNLKSTPFKAQLAVPGRKTAVRYYHYFKERKKINAELVISPPDTREGNDEIYEDSKSEVQVFWRHMMDKYGTKEDYERSIINLFNSDSEEVELLIVVSKLLTGFDSPRNTVLYLAKYLEEHNLLQAIARVNRVYNGKDYGFVIDYMGILKTLTEALTTYKALQKFDETDLMGTITPIQEVIEKLPQYHSDLWDVFRQCTDIKDKEAVERYLRPEDRRDEFYEKLSRFARTLQTAFSADNLFDIIDEEDIIRYKNDLKFFENLRRSVRIRYAESIDHREYEARVRKLLDSYIGTEGITQTIEPIDIFSKDFSEKHLEMENETDASKADRIASNTKKVITERMDEDPAMYRKFSDMIDETIQKFLEERISEREYLNNIQNIKNGVEEGYWEDMPTILKDKPEVRSFYNTVKNEMDTYVKTVSKNKQNQYIDNQRLEEKYIQAGLDMNKILDNLIIVDWQNNPDVKDTMKNELEDYLIDFFNDLGMERNFDVIERIMNTVIKAKESFSER